MVGLIPDPSHCHYAIISNRSKQGRFVTIIARRSRSESGSIYTACMSALVRKEQRRTIDFGGVGQRRILHTTSPAPTEDLKEEVRVLVWSHVRLRSQCRGSRLMCQRDLS